MSSKRLSPIPQVAPDAVLAFAPLWYDILCPSDAEDAQGLRKRNAVEVRVIGTNVDPAPNAPMLVTQRNFLMPRRDVMYAPYNAFCTTHIVLERRS